ncbi:hypothetical protein BDA96_05G049100 [Sorghum bicolor]|jgi:hypothetical protein|uniref:Granulins domain-containing protein n=2 Tax=Sorghum bicolor TaxID=4558 RepID=A0A921UEN3_SORBI|nr:hypothetical protein BDA96_05G049100 [Sorghum bicolor]KXG27799.1 hypothetical protein SORBI_3005G046400 [Sorghum bicolor]
MECSNKQALALMVLMMVPMMIAPPSAAMAAFSEPEPAADDYGDGTKQTKAVARRPKISIRRLLQNDDCYPVWYPCVYGPDECCDYGTNFCDYSFDGGAGYGRCLPPCWSQGCVGFPGN